MSTKKGGGTWVWLALLALGGSAFGAWKAGWIGKSEEAVLLGAPVERKTLVISVVQAGNLAAKDSVSVKSEVEGQTTILSLIAEGTFVKPGDLLAELDVSELRERKVAQEISVQNAEASYVKARAQFEIQESQNQSDIEAAERKLLFAKKDEEKYLKGDLAQLKSAAEEKIKLAEAEIANSENTYNWSKKLADKGFLTTSELDRDRLDFQRAEVQLVQAKRALDLLVDYDDPRQKIELTADVQEAERGLERAKLAAKSRLADFESSLVTSESKLKLEREKLQKYDDQIAKARIVATQPGMVVYARTEGGRMGGSEPIQVGTQVRERQEILSIPRTAGLIVEASVHESVLKQVAIGKPCKIVVDAIPGMEFEGRVQFVALLADKASWWANPNQRLYRTEISVSNPHPDMRPGMSCGIEILSDIVPDALVVPLQSIFVDEGKTIAFVVRGQSWDRRDVKTGRSSQTLVEIVEGLKEGESVLLSAPPGFSPKAAESIEDGSSFTPTTAAEAAAAAAAAKASAPAAPSGLPGAMQNGMPNADGPRGAEGGAPGGADAQRPRGERRGGGNRPEGMRGGGNNRAREGGAGPGAAGAGDAPRNDTSKDETSTVEKASGESAKGDTSAPATTPAAEPRSVPGGGGR
jgi:HlyD family secretion protein